MSPAAVRFTIAQLRSATDITGIALSGNDLSGFDLSGLNLSSANLSNAKLASVNLLNTTLSTANLSNANLSSANLSNANLASANLSSADLRNANVSEAITSAQLRGAAKVTGVNLSGNNLNGFDLSGLNLTSAILTSANLNGANLTGTNLNLAQLPSAMPMLPAVSGAVVTANSNLNVSGQVLVDSGGRLNILNSTFSAGSAQVAAGGWLSISNSSANFNNGLTNRGCLELTDSTINGSVSSPGWTFFFVQGNVTFSGSVNGAGNFWGTGVTTFNGGYSPGDSPAYVTFEGPMACGAGNLLTIELAGLLSGTYDELNVAGDVSLTGYLTVHLRDGFTLATSAQFGIINVGGNLTGQFAGLGEGSLVGNYGGRDLFITYAGGDGNDVVLYTTPVTVVPGDANGDHMVNLSDYNILKDNWLQTVTPSTDGDFNGDGVVNLSDYNILKDNWLAVQRN